MTKAIPLTSAKILESMHRTNCSSPAGSSADAVSNVPGAMSAALAHSAPPVGQGSVVQRVLFARHLRKVLDSYSPLIIEHTVRVLIARELDRIDAAADQHSLHVLVRKGQHGQQIVAAGQRLDEKLMEIEECGQDRWAEALARRIIALASQRADGLLTEEAFRRAADFAVARYDEMQRRLTARVDGIRHATDALVEFGRGDTAINNSSK